MFYVIDFYEQGLGRTFWYVWGNSELLLKRIFDFTDEQWEYFKLGLEIYETYKEVCDAYRFMPHTFVPPYKMEISWS